MWGSVKSAKKQKGEEILTKATDMMREWDKLKVLEKEGTILVKFGQVLVIFNRNTHAEYENDSYEDEAKGDENIAIAEEKG